jgi:hypothetical protein
MVVDEMINSKGGYKRKVSTLIGHLSNSSDIEMLNSVNMEGSDIMLNFIMKHK